MDGGTRRPEGEGEEENRSIRRIVKGSDVTGAANEA